MSPSAPGGRARSAPIMGRDAEPTIFELSAPGRRAASFRATGLPEWSAADLIPDQHRAEPGPDIAELSAVLVRDEVGRAPLGEIGRAHV